MSKAELVEKFITDTKDMTSGEILSIFEEYTQEDRYKGLPDNMKEVLDEFVLTVFYRKTALINGKEF